jgi:hypothetical protein
MTIPPSSALPKPAEALQLAHSTPHTAKTMDLFMQDSPSDASSETVHSTSLFAVTPNEQAGQSPPSQSAPSEPAQPRKRGRKGHSKSRTGCFKCKRARIKVRDRNFVRMGKQAWLMGRFSARRIAQNVTTVPTAASNASGPTSKSTKSGP